MAKSSIVSVQNLGVHVASILEEYNAGVNERVEVAAKKAVEDLVTETKATAPTGYRGSFRRHITSGESKKTRTSTTYAWYVKPPDHRLTHLLVHGHATRDGGRTRANPFLNNAISKILPAFEKEVEEAVKDAR